MNFSWAMDLDPKGANNQIKEAIDKRYLPDDEEPITQEEQISEYHPYDLGLYVIIQTRKLVKHHIRGNRYFFMAQNKVENFLNIQKAAFCIRILFLNTVDFYTKWNFREIEQGNVTTVCIWSQVTSFSSESSLLCDFDKSIADFYLNFNLCN